MTMIQSKTQNADLYILQWDIDIKYPSQLKI